jgi:hypothetical protein
MKSLFGVAVAAMAGVFAGATEGVVVAETPALVAALVCVEMGASISCVPAEVWSGKQGCAEAYNTNISAVSRANATTKPIAMKRRIPRSLPCPRAMYSPLILRLACAIRFMKSAIMPLAHYGAATRTDHTERSHSLRHYHAS